MMVYTFKQSKAQTKADLNKVGKFMGNVREGSALWIRKLYMPARWLAKR